VQRGNVQRGNVSIVTRGIETCSTERMPVKPAPFTYHRTCDVAETVSLLAELGDEAKILAGGQSLVPMMNFRLARPSALVDVTRIPGLDYLRVGDDGLHVGALTRHRSVETTRDPAVLSGFAVLPRSARWIGHYPIRARGTFGGSIAHADPAAEWCLLAVLLDANVVLCGPAGRRVVPAAEFFEGFYTTVAQPDEMITEIWFPRPATRAVLTEFSQRQGDFAVVAAAVSADLADGVCRSARVVLGGVGPLPFTVDTGALAGQSAVADTWRAAGELAAAQIDPPADGHGSGEYRKKLAATLVSRALAEASELTGPAVGAGGDGR
jgi:aerobic carbon-monoxide dehydrogenase medium subunit